MVNFDWSYDRAVRMIHWLSLVFGLSFLAIFDPFDLWCM